MPETQIIRISMPDKPGALSQVTLALAAHQVDITHLDVVSAHDGMVVDDLTLVAETIADIRKAISSFRQEVAVMTLPGTPGDPVFELGGALTGLATAPDVGRALQQVMTGCQRFIRADEAFVQALDPSGAVTTLASARPLPGVSAGDVFAGRALLSPAMAATFAGASDWAPASLRDALGASVVAMAPLGGTAILGAIRISPIPFTAGEMRRMALFSGAASAILGARGLIGATPGLESTGQLPPGAITELVPAA